MACLSNSILPKWKKSPSSFFDWNKSKRPSQDKPQPKYHNIDLPFSPSLLRRTFLQGRELKCCHRASIDGFSANSFHNYCDFKGPCVVIGYTTKFFKFGAFNPGGGSGAALFDYARGGPQFGADGLLSGPPLAPVLGGLAGPDTNSGIGDLRQAKSRLGLSYAQREDGKESLFGDECRITLVEVQVFCSPQIASLY
ncbi:hypothetical protein NE237_025646 [Protea cynaroides]|uniref:TLDc domain-containing protein n=1 Tax=Protea cynaroides TaxID=273540 RepID=A0A9Q0K1I8_9MAGN|nr:hypothetical protein NE237_025646 [Protea cynaroides]